MRPCSLHGDEILERRLKPSETICVKRERSLEATWLWIIVAIGTLGTPPTKARH
jgi:hypothetical protein